MSNRLEGKVALVTACTRGIGRAIADLFVDEGAKVYYACRNMETGKAAVEAARARGGQAELVYFEAHDPATHRSMIDECIAKEGRLDVLVNNFGESNPRKDLDITKCTYKEFEKTVCVDLSTVFNACQEALNKAMIKQHSGSIINIGSVAAVCPDRTQVGYGVAKSTSAARWRVRSRTRVCASTCSTPASSPRRPSPSISRPRRSRATRPTA